MKCSECEFRIFAKDQHGGISRHCCTHPAAAAVVCASSRVICRTDRRSSELKVKTAPRWCPLKQEVSQ